MDYVLYVYGATLFAAVYGFIWTLGGRRARLVLTLGAYAIRLDRPRGTRRHHPDHRRRAITVAALADLLPRQERPTPGIDTAPTVTIPAFVPAITEAGTALESVLLPHLVHAEQAVNEYGAEHWGTLLADMNTEERTIYNAELVATYEATKAIERPFLDGLDAAMAAFTAAMDRSERREAAAWVGVGHNLLKGHGGADRWSTGQFPILEPAST